MTQTTKYYTYAHYRKDNGNIFYIGLGKDGRCYSTRGRNKHWINITNKTEYDVKILSYWNTREEAGLHEQLLISIFRDISDSLVNICDGGISNHLPGKLNGMFGKKHSDAAKQKIRERRKTQTFSLETRAKISKANAGSNNAMYGVKRPEVNERSNKHVMCPHCEIEGQFLAMKRWHFDNCKYMNRKE